MGSSPPRPTTFWNGYSRLSSTELVCDQASQIAVASGTSALRGPLATDVIAMRLMVEALMFSAKSIG